MNTLTEETTIKAEFFATISKGKIVTFAQAIPPTHELLDCQTELTKQEYFFLQKLNGEDLNVAASLIKAIKAKIKANGS